MQELTNESEMDQRVFHRDGSLPEGDAVFVFGSNTVGWHAGGAAHAAVQMFGARMGVAEGMTGNAYAIPTCTYRIEALPLDAIRKSVDAFIARASADPTRSFFVTRIGCGIAGHRDSDIAPMFADAPMNCSMPDTWAKFI